MSIDLQIAAALLLAKQAIEISNSSEGSNPQAVARQRSLFGEAARALSLLAASPEILPARQTILRRFADAYTLAAKDPAAAAATASFAASSLPSPSPSTVTPPPPGRPSNETGKSAGSSALTPVAPKDKQGGEGNVNTMSSLPFEVVPISANETAPVAPIDPSQQIFWLMKHVQNVLQKGGLITPTIFVPVCIWTGAWNKMTALPDKISAFDSVTERLAALSAIDPDNSRTFLKELDVLVAHLTSVQAQMSKLFSYVSTPEQQDHSKSLFGGKFSKLISRATAAVGSGSRDDELPQQYVHSICAVLEAAAFLETRMKQFATDAAGVHKMQKVITFMQQCVLVIVLRDLQTQLENYLRSCNKRLLRTTKSSSDDSR